MGHVGADSGNHDQNATHPGGVWWSGANRDPRETFMPSARASAMGAPTVVRLAAGGGLLLAVTDVVGAFWLGYLVLGIDREWRWFYALVELSEGPPTLALMTYLVVPSLLVGTSVFGLARWRGLRDSRWDDLLGLVVPVAVPAGAVFAVAFTTALDDLVWALGAAGLLVGGPFAVGFITLGVGVLVVSHLAAGGVGYGLVEGTAWIRRRVAGGVDADP